MTLSSHSPSLAGREKEIFLGALEKATPAERAAYLSAACGDDHQLRAAVEDLLRNHVEDAFLDQPATVIDSAAEARRGAGATAEDPFSPGELFGDRYRIVGLLGEGGMGKVYRADDLKLGQSVALKFLPPALATDPVWLLRFRNEVRVAREVAHPNVCRVYDIGEADGEHFISMEFVDGEDLTSLLRRIGRLPQDKAVEIARQLCAGLAAAHARSVVHRDLKPANIMIDGRGKVRITDFGIAALAGQIQGKDVRAGTPSYMAPEQLAGTEVTIRSDIYALGLVLYEIFTGKKAIDGTSITQIHRAHERGTPATPASYVRDLDPQVERIILRCLEPDPKNRPRSAMAVAAALPGTDLLAEAIASGDTPSPELIAEAGETGSLRPWVAISCLAAVVAGLIGTIAVKDKVSLLRRVPFNKPPAVLADRAEQISQRLGYTNAPADRAFWFESQPEVLDYLTNTPPSSNRWQQLASGRPAAIAFSYRAAPQKMDVVYPRGGIDWANPSFTEPDMRRLQLDTRGRLLAFHAVPPNHHKVEASIQEPDWSLVFAEAELNVTNFAPVASVWTPDVFCDHRRAWIGPYPEWPAETLRVEAGSFKGRPVFFKLIGPWLKEPSSEASHTNSGASIFRPIFKVVWTVILLVLLASVGYLARRNLLSGRGDGTGARRVGFLVFLSSLIGFVFTAHSLGWHSVRNAVFARIGAGFLTWLLYLAIEPYARRHWPHTLISWSRLLAGRVRYPSIGRDLLVGCLAGIAFALLDGLLALAPETSTGLDPIGPQMPGSFGVLLGEAYIIGEILGPLGRVGLFMETFLVLLLLRIILKRTWVTIAVSVSLFALGMIDVSTAAWATWVWAFAAASLLVVVGVRFGLLALVVMIVSGIWVLFFPATFDFSAWWAGSGIIGPLLVLALATYGSWMSMAGKPLFKDEVLATRP